MTAFSDPAVATWFNHNTVSRPAPALADLITLKKQREASVGVCLPALDEASTIASICRTIVTELGATGFVDQLVVIDSGSTDDTVELAGGAGATVHRARDLVRDAPPISNPGKGESLWKSLAVVETDIVVWLDSDTRNFGAHYVTDLVAPLLSDESLVLTKAYYERPLHTEDGLARTGGGRVTELAIRPLINLLYPELAGFIQPLSGEYAGRREVLLELPFGVGYEVELLLLIDLIERYGLDAIAQVDLGSRIHRNRGPDGLGRMSFEIMKALLARLEDGGRLKLAELLPEMLTQFIPSGDGYEPRVAVQRAERRPPMSSVLD